METAASRYCPVSTSVLGPPRRAEHAEGLNNTDAAVWNQGVGRTLLLLELFRRDRPTALSQLLVLLAILEVPVSASLLTWLPLCLGGLFCLCSGHAPWIEGPPLSSLPSSQLKDIYRDPVSK